MMLAALLHPHLPRIYDHFLENGRWYLVMDFIDGQTLDEYLGKQPGSRLPLQEALDDAIQLCSVLEYLHTRQQPIIFRDLKPSNVMRTNDEQLYLVDFGIARHFKSGQAKDSDSIHVASGSKDGTVSIYQTNKAPSDSNTTIHNIHSTAVEAIAWSPDGKLLASASDDGTVRILDPVTGTINLIYKGHTRPVKTVAWSPDGTQLASAGEDETVQLWDITGKKLFTHLDYYAAIYTVAWSPDGKRIAAGDAHKLVHVWIAR